MAQLIKIDGSIIVVEPQNGKDFKLDELRKYLEGGYIEVIRLAGTPQNRIMLVDEDGISKQSRLNRAASLIAGQQILGNVLVCDGKQIE